MKYLLLILFLTGCNNARDQNIANAAATIYEAADAIEKGVPSENPVQAIKASANYIVEATLGEKYK